LFARQEAIAQPVLASEDARESVTAFSGKTSGMLAAQVTPGVTAAT
jgi:hypothetical protein